MNTKDLETLAWAIKSAHAGTKSPTRRVAAAKVVNALRAHLVVTVDGFDLEAFIEACGLRVVPVKAMNIDYINDPRFALVA